MVSSISPNNIGSVGRNNPILPSVNSSKLIDIGVKKAMLRNVSLG